MRSMNRAASEVEREGAGVEVIEREMMDVSEWDRGIEHANPTFTVSCGVKQSSLHE